MNKFADSKFLSKVSTAAIILAIPFILVGFIGKVALKAVGK